MPLATGLLSGEHWELRACMACFGDAEVTRQTTVAK